MGNFTQDAFFRKVSPNVRREMAESARKALLTLGVSPSAIPWPARDDAPKHEPDLVVVVVTLIEQLEALGRELRDACVEASTARKPDAAAIEARAKAAYEFYYSYEHVAQDLFNTIAGDLVSEHNSDSKRLGRSTEALKTPIGLLKNEFYSLHASDGPRDAVHFECSVELLNIGLEKLKGLARRVESAARPR